jgi:hypothetical protein
MPATFTPYASAHVGPKGGTEYRVWSSPDTFRVVGRFKALPLMSEDAKAHAVSLESARKLATQAAATREALWRSISRR